MNFKTLACGVALSGLLASGALAADLPYSVPAAGAPQSWGGPYVSIKGAVNFQDDSNFLAGTAPGTTSETETDTGFGVSGAVGYAWGSRWGVLAPRIEAEFGYLTNDVDTFDVNTAADPVAAAGQGEINATYGFANLIFDVPLGWGFTPFFGGGVGYANVRFDNVGLAATAAAFDDEDTSFAWNLTAGVGYEIARGVNLELAYRFVQFNSVDIQNAAGTVTSSDDIDNHQVVGAIRYRF